VTNLSSIRDLVRIILPLEWTELEHQQKYLYPLESDPAWIVPPSSLDELIARLLPIVSADGIAVAFKEGTDFVCGASRGSAPKIGAVIQPGVGQCGTCVQQRRTIVEQEIEDELRSIVAVPVYTGTRLTGCLAAFSRRPHAFRDIDIDTMIAVADHLRDCEAPAKSPEQASRDVPAEPAQKDDHSDYLTRLHESLYPTAKGMREFGA
jgi:hypothetical protein